MRALVGIANAAAAGMQGLMEGEEIARRRSIEDKRLAREEDTHKWELKNRGKIEEEWKRADALREAMSLGTPEERIKALRAKNLGPEADNYEAITSQRERERIQADLGFRLNQIQLQDAERNQVNRAIATGFSEYMAASRSGDPEKLAAAERIHGPMLEKIMPNVAGMRILESHAPDGTQYVEYSTKDDPKKMKRISFEALTYGLDNPFFHKMADSQRDWYAKQMQVNLQREHLRLAGGSKFNEKDLTLPQLLATAKASGGFRPIGNMSGASLMNYTKSLVEQQATAEFNAAASSANGGEILQKLGLPSNTPTAKQRNLWILMRKNENNLLGKSDLAKAGFTKEEFESITGTPVSKHSQFDDPALYAELGVDGQTSEAPKIPARTIKSGKQNILDSNRQVMTR